MMEKLSLSVLRQSLLTTYKSFVKPKLAHADIIFHKPHNGSIIVISN